MISLSFESRSNISTRILCRAGLTWDIGDGFAYRDGMKIVGILETTQSGVLEQLESGCSEYWRGFDAMRRMVPEGVLLLSVRVSWYRYASGDLFLASGRRLVSSYAVGKRR